MRVIDDNLKECLEWVKKVEEVEGGWVPRDLYHMLLIFGNRHSDENEIRKRASDLKVNDVEGNGSDAIKWNLARYCCQWLRGYHLVRRYLGKDLASIPFDHQLQEIDEAVAMEQKEALEKERLFRENHGIKAEDGHDPWFDLIPTKYRSASMKDFPNSWDKFDHIATGGSMLMLGPTGVGKSRLLWAMASELARGGLDTKEIKVTTLQELLAKVRSSPGDWTEEVSRLYGKCIWLFVDECDKVNGSENDITITSALVNERYQWERGTVFVGNGTRDSIIQKLGEPVVSRLTAGNEKGKLFMVNGKDRRTT